MLKQFFPFYCMIAIFFSAVTNLAYADEFNDYALIGLDADISSGSKKAGIAIKRGIELAIDDINAAGGLNGKRLKLVVRNHRGNPARGIDNIEAFAAMKNLVAVVGGLHTPVAMAELKTIHKNKILYLSPWAAGTPVIANGFNPSYTFRVSVRDEYAGGFLIKKAIERGYKKPALFLEQTGWGRSNNKSMTKAIKAHSLGEPLVQWFNWGVKDLSAKLRHARAEGADVIMLVANSPEGITCIKSMAQLPKNERLPIISHWGITGGDFIEKSEQYLSGIELVFLQTYSFIKPVFADRNAKLVNAYMAKYKEIDSINHIFAPAGTAHAYDIVHLLAKAAIIAGSLERSKIRDAMEKIKFHKGVMRDYAPAFTNNRHDALDISDFILAEYDTEGHIVPVRDAD